MDYTFHYESPLGGITLVSHGEAITGLWFDGQKHFASTLSREHREGDLPLFRDASRWLDVYFGGGKPDFTPPLAPEGTEFQKAVWEILLTNPYGETRTYGQLARALAERRGRQRISPQAVGSAVGRNPISLLIPCHRVVGADGSLTGYAGGLDKKLRLLRLEGADTEKMFIPKRRRGLP